MGLMSRMRTQLAWSERLAPSKPTRITTPWSEGQTLGVIAADIFGGEYAPVTRDEAMRVPAIAKGRAIICGTLAKQPIVLEQDGVKLDVMPAWVQGTNTDVPPWHRMAWTLDDLIFHSWSLWAREDLDGELRAAMRVPFDRWRFNEHSQVEVEVNGAWFPANNSEVILFAGPQEGLLDIGRDTIRAARAIERTILDRSRTPYSAIDIEQVDGTVLESDEIEDLITGYLDSRRKVDGSSIGYVPPGVALKYHGEKVDMLLEARNALRLDAAAFLNLPGQILDASLSTASLTYSTKEGARNELLDYSLGFWADPIAARLSQDDVVDPGIRSRFDLTEFVAIINSPTGPSTTD